MEIKATRKAHFPDLKNPGDFIFTTKMGMSGHTGIHFVCPCGCGEMGGVSFVPELPYLPDPWKWDGNEEKPTVTPSILRMDGCKWHGYLTAGVFKSV